MPKNRISKTATLHMVQRQVKSPFGVPYASLKKLEAHLSPNEREHVIKNRDVSTAWRGMSRRQRKRVLAALNEPKPASSPKRALEKLTSITARVHAREKRRRAMMRETSMRPVRVVKAATGTISRTEHYYLK